MHKLVTLLNTRIKITNNHQEVNVRKDRTKRRNRKKEVVYPETVSVKSLRRSVVWRNSPGRIGGLNPLRATSQRRASLQPLRRTSRPHPSLILLRRNSLYGRQAGKVYISLVVNLLRLFLACSSTIAVELRSSRWLHPTRRAAPQLRVLATRKRSKWNPLNHGIFISCLAICIQIWHVRAPVLTFRAPPLSVLATYANWLLGDYSPFF